jgi:hypothetical protein
VVGAPFGSTVRHAPYVDPELAQARGDGRCVELFEWGD